MNICPYNLAKVGAEPCWKDGNCLFRCLAQVFGFPEENTSLHEMIRNCIVDHVVDCWTKYKQHAKVYGMHDSDVYKSIMSQSSTFASEVELEAASDVFECRIMVWAAEGICISSGRPWKRTVHLLHSGPWLAGHFETVSETCLLTDLVLNMRLCVPVGAVRLRGGGVRQNSPTDTLRTNIIHSSSPPHERTREMKRRRTSSSSSHEDSGPHPKQRKGEGRSEEYSKDGVSRSLHGILFQVYVTMLFVIVAADNFRKFRLASEMKNAEKFDDLVFEFQDENQQRKINFVQMKHLSTKTQKGITAKDLWSVKRRDGAFSLIKYFNSFLSIKKRIEQSYEMNSIFTDSEIQNVFLWTNSQVDKTLPFVKCHQNEGLLQHIRSKLSSSEIYVHMFDVSKASQLVPKLSPYFVFGSEFVDLLKITLNKQMSVKDLGKVVNLIPLVRDVFHVDKVKKKEKKVLVHFSDSFIKGNVHQEVLEFRSYLIRELKFCRDWGSYRNITDSSNFADVTKNMRIEISKRLFNVLNQESKHLSIDEFPEHIYIAQKVIYVQTKKFRRSDIFTNIQQYFKPKPVPDFDSIDEDFGLPEFPSSDQQLEDITQNVADVLLGKHPLSCDKQSIRFDLVLKDKIFQYDRKSKTWSLQDSFKSLEKLDPSLWRFRDSLLRRLFSETSSSETENKNLLASHNIEVTGSTFSSMQNIKKFMKDVRNLKSQDPDALAEVISSCVLLKGSEDEPKQRVAIRETMSLHGLFGNVFSRNLQKTKLSSKFVNGEHTDDPWIGRLRHQLGKKFQGNNLNDLEFQIPDLKISKEFEVCYEEGALDTKLPRIPLESDINTFFEHLRLVTAFPSYKKLLALIVQTPGISVSAELERDYFFCKLKDKIVHWLANRKGLYLNATEVKCFVQEVKRSIYLYSAGLQREMFFAELPVKLPFLPFKNSFKRDFVHAEGRSAFLICARFRDTENNRDDFHFLKASSLKDRSVVQSFDFLSQFSNEKLRFLVYFDVEDIHRLFSDEALQAWKLIFQKSLATVVVSSEGNHSAAYFVEQCLGNSTHRIYLKTEYVDLDIKSKADILSSMLYLQNSDRGVSLENVLGVNCDVPDADVNAAVSVSLLEVLMKQKGREKFCIGSRLDEEHEMANIIHFGPEIPEICLSNLEAVVKEMHPNSMIIVSKLTEQHPANQRVRSFARKSNERLQILDEREKFDLMTTIKRFPDKKIFYMECDKLQLVYDPQLFVERNVYNIILKKGVFKKCQEDAFLVLKKEMMNFRNIAPLNVTKLEMLGEEILKSQHHSNVFFVEDSILANPKMYIPEFENHHHVSPCDSFIKCVKSYNDIGALRKYVTDCKNLKSKITSEDLRMGPNNLFSGMILYGPAGAGKSAYFHQMHRVLSDKCWVLRKDLKFFTRPIGKSKRTDNVVGDVMDAGEVARILTSNIDEQNLLKFRLLHSSISDSMLPIHVLLDGFDEIEDEENKKALEAVLKNFKSKVIFSVSTRSYKKNRVEMALGKLALRLIPFEKDEKEKFLLRFWSDCLELQPSSVDKFKELKACVMNIILKIATIGKTIGIALEIRMFAEFLIPDIVSAVLDKKPINLQAIEDPLDIFKEFIKRKYQLYFAIKRNYNLSALDCFILTRAYDEIFTEYALQSLNMKTVLSKKLQLSSWKLTPEAEDALLTLGVITLREGKVFFLHDSYAECFIATRILKCLREEKDCKSLKLFMKKKKEENPKPESKWGRVLVQLKYRLQASPALLNDETSEASPKKSLTPKKSPRRVKDNEGIDPSQRGIRDFLTTPSKSSLNEEVSTIQIKSLETP